MQLAVQDGKPAIATIDAPGARKQPMQQMVKVQAAIHTRMLAIVLGSYSPIAHNYIWLGPWKTVLFVNVMEDFNSTCMLQACPCCKRFWEHMHP